MTASCSSCSWSGEWKGGSLAEDARCPICNASINLSDGTRIGVVAPSSNSSLDIDPDFLKTIKGNENVNYDVDTVGPDDEDTLSNAGAPTDPPKKHKLTMLGSYKILAKIGEGAMGRVYLAEDTIGQRQVAIKVLPKEFAQDKEMLSRFKREAKASCQLKHENIAGAYACEDAHALNFLVMEYCDGRDLASILERKKYLNWKHATKIVLQVALGLKYAHDQGMIHRDIKPSNIILTREGLIKILDFGLVKYLSSTSSIASGSSISYQTVSGVAVGTPLYISPEQALALKDIDGRTDIYSLGVTYYHLVTGCPPFAITSGAAVVFKHIDEDVPNPQEIHPEIPDRVADIIQIMTERDPDERYADCVELLGELKGILGSPA